MPRIISQGIEENGRDNRNNVCSVREDGVGWFVSPTLARTNKGRQRLAVTPWEIRVSDGI